MFRKLCDSSTYTIDIRERMDKLEADLQYCANVLTLDASLSVVHLSRGKAYRIDCIVQKIREKMISIQAMMTPHLEVMQMHLKNAKELVQEDPNLAFVDSMWILQQIWRQSFMPLNM